MKLPYLAIRLWLGSAAFAVAQTTPATPPAGGPRHGGPGHGPGGHPIVRVLDTDKDGTLSAAELAAAATGLLTLDTNSDGALSAEEIHARPANAPTPPADAPARPANATGTPPADRPHPTDPVMLALDADANGSLSAAEIANAPKSLAALDLNKDGKLTPDEYRPLPPERPTS
jgi:hypothetical protein